MILITGANGKLGSKVIETLLQKNMPAGQIAALVRNEAKAAGLKEKGVEIRIGDYNDELSLNAAMKGIEKVLLVSGVDIANVVKQHMNVIEAAKRNGVKCLAYTSNCLRDRATLMNRIMLTHFETEDYLKTSGLNYIIFRNVLYMDSMAMYMLGKDVLDTGIQLPASNGRVSYALRSEEAEAIANVLALGDCGNRIYNFTNKEAYSFADVAAVLSSLSGRPVAYTPIDMETYKKRAKEKGMPEQAVEAMAPFMTDIANGQGSTVSSDLEAALGRQPADLKSGLKLLLGL